MLNKITTFLKEVQLEMKKVNWPTREETIRYTLMVIGVAVAVAVFLGGFDFIFTDLRNCYFLKVEPCYTGRLLGF
ncbi:MAG TPA: preprotein translocase subunit SecE [Candidatus Humimicrobiaceae bacterium]|nr:preprotein translocase subunit SecE [Candidatus Humimicrobiaceae bacterium]